LLECHDNVNGEVRQTLLEKEYNRPFYLEFREKKAQNLEVIEGIDNPIILLGGDQLKNIKVLNN